MWFVDLPYCFVLSSRLDVVKLGICAHGEKVEPRVDFLLRAKGSTYPLIDITSFFSFISFWV